MTTPKGFQMISGRLRFSFLPPMKKKLRSVPGIRNNSLIHKFISSGKPGNCSLCKRFANKLEAHHISYLPEITINLCHECHHRCHFWPLRLSADEKYQLFSLVFPAKKSEILAKHTTFTAEGLSRMIAPSRKSFIHGITEREGIKSHIQFHQKNIPKRILKHGKVFKAKHISKSDVRVPQAGGRVA